MYFFTPKGSGVKSTPDPKEVGIRVRVDSFFLRVRGMGKRVYPFGVQVRGWGTSKGLKRRRKRCQAKKSGVRVGVGIRVRIRGTVRGKKKYLLFTVPKKNERGNPSLPLLTVPKKNETVKKGGGFGKKGKKGMVKKVKRVW